jgi:hypothetical protein
MTNNDLKKTFGEIANLYGFKFIFNGWIKESDFSILVLDLQKSKNTDYFDLNIKIYLQGIFEKKYKVNKEIVKNDTGDIFRRQPQEYKSLFWVNENSKISEKKEEILLFFKNFLSPFANKSLDKNGIIQLSTNGDIFLLPAVKEFLDL